MSSDLTLTAYFLSYVFKVISIFLRSHCLIFINVVLLLLLFNTAYCFILHFLFKIISVSSFSCLFLKYGSLLFSRSVSFLALHFSFLYSTLQPSTVSFSYLNLLLHTISCLYWRFPIFFFSLCQFSFFLSFKLFLLFFAHTIQFLSLSFFF